MRAVLIAATAAAAAVPVRGACPDSVDKIPCPVVSFCSVPLNSVAKPADCATEPLSQQITQNLRDNQDVPDNELLFVIHKTGNVAANTDDPDQHTEAAAKIAAGVYRIQKSSNAYNPLTYGQPLYRNGRFADINLRAPELNGVAQLEFMHKSIMGQGLAYVEGNLDVLRLDGANVPFGATGQSKHEIYLHSSVGQYAEDSWGFRKLFPPTQCHFDRLDEPFAEDTTYRSEIILDTTTDHYEFQAPLVGAANIIETYAVTKRELIAACEVAPPPPTPAPTPPPTVGVVDPACETFQMYEPITPEDPFNTFDKQLKTLALKQPKINQVKVLDASNVDACDVTLSGRRFSFYKRNADKTEIEEGQSFFYEWRASAFRMISDCVQEATRAAINEETSIGARDVILTIITMSPFPSDDNGNRLLVPKVLQIIPADADHDGDVFKTVHETILRDNLNETNYDHLNHNKGQDVGMVFVGVQNGAQIDLDERGDPGACIANKIVSEAVLKWERQEACIAQSALRFELAEGIPNTEFANNARSCWHYPDDDCDGDHEPDWADPCVCNGGVHSGNFAELSPLCEEQTQSGTKTHSKICTATIDEETGKPKDTDSDGTHDCVDICPFINVIPNKTVDDKSVKIAEACFAIVRKGECPVEDSASMEDFIDHDVNGMLQCEEVCDINPSFTHSGGDGSECHACPCDTQDYGYLEAMGITSGACGDEDNDGFPNCVDPCPKDAGIPQNNCGICGEANVANPPDDCPAKPEYCGTEDLPSDDPYGCKCDHTTEFCDKEELANRKECPNIDMPNIKEDIRKFLAAQTDVEIPDAGGVHTVKLLERLSDDELCTCVIKKADVNEFELVDGENDGVVDCFEDEPCKADVDGAFLNLCEPTLQECQKNPTPLSTLGNPLCTANVFGGICNDFNKDTDGDGHSDCIDMCPAGSSRQVYMPHGAFSNFRSCGCSWPASAAATNSDADTVVDCHDVCCSTRLTATGKTEKCHRIMPGYDSNDDNATNTADDDKDTFHNCYDACPGGANRDPSDPASPCAIGLAAPPVVPPVKRNVSEPMHDYEWVISVLGGVISGVVLGVITFRSDREGAAKKAASDRAV